MIYFADALNVLYTYIKFLYRLDFQMSCPHKRVILFFMDGNPSRIDKCA